MKIFPAIPELNASEIVLLLLKHEALRMSHTNEKQILAFTIFSPIEGLSVIAMLLISSFETKYEFIRCIF